MMPSTQIFTVTDLTRQIKGLLEDKFPAVWVEGEISNLAIAASGHAYFTLKDANAQLSAVMFRGVAGKLNFKLADGMAVVAFGEISVYEKRGQYQLIVTQLLPKGLGALQLAFEQLKKKLAAEGLFEPDRKKPLPAFPQRIGLVTSPAGAAVRDFLKIVGRRFPNLHIIINPVRVQGAGAAEEIAAAVDEFNTLRWTGVTPVLTAVTGETPVQLPPLVDVIIVTRGGGSLEDLWAFNEEIVARAIARSAIPTISAVGHEIDFTIADFVADLRAPTPSAAAELVIRSKEEFQAELAQHQKRLDKDLRYRLSEARRRLVGCRLRHPAELVRQYQQQTDDLRHRLLRASSLDAQRSRLETAAGKFKLLSPATVIRAYRQRLDTQSRQLDTLCSRYRQDKRQHLTHLTGKLNLLSPQSTLQRGYSITRTPEGKIIKTVTAVKRGDAVRTLLADGEIESTVK